MQLYEHQKRAVEGVLKKYSRGCKAPLLVAMCGFGKTVVFSHIAARARAKGNRILVVLHRQELMRQTCSTLDQFNVPYGLIAAGQSSDEQQLVQVASIYTLARRLGAIEPPRLIVIDEAHHASANTWRNVIKGFPSAKILGVTATPIRNSGAGLGDIFDSLVVGESTEWLIAGGWLAKPTYYVPPQVADFADVKSRAGDYAQDALAERMDKPHITGDAVSHYLKICPGAPAVAFCTSIRHAESVAECFRKRGINALSIDGSLSDADRAGRIDDLAAGRIKVLTSCELISEGFDLPAVTAAIMLRPTQSLAVWIQQAGRAIRPAPGKERAIILDHVGNVERHGLIEDVRDWTLEGRKKRERAANDNFPIIRRCPSCFVVYRPGRKTCPECGAESVPSQREIEQREGELRELQRQAEHKQARREVAHAQSLEDLTELGRRRGYQYPREWAEHVMRARGQRQGRAYA